MARKKKNQNGDVEKPQEEKKGGFSIASDAKRSVVAIVLFALAILIILGFFGASGAVGDFLNKATGIFIGWGKIIFPFFLAVFGIVLLFRKETFFYVTKLGGFSTMLLSIAGFFHWFFEKSEMLSIARAGKGGGYLGYGVAYVSTKYIGVVGGLVAIVALFFVGMIVAFNVSIIHFLARFKRKESVENETAKIQEEKTVDGKPETSRTEELGVSESKPPEERKDPDGNIGRIEFVEGPDRYVSPSLLEKSSLQEEGNGGATVGFRRSSLSENGRRGGKKNGKGRKWELPTLELLEESSGVAKSGDTEQNAEIIEKTLRNFGIEVERGEIKVGPSVTQYSFRPAVGIKIAKIMSLQNDLSLALAAHPIRIEAPIPGKSLIGIEVPNKASAMVRLKNILDSSDFRYRDSNLKLALGEDVSGNYILSDLAKMPHLMIAGATGTGKSVSINALITTLLYQNSPEELKFIMIDPKRVELSLYNGIPHLLSDVVVENSKVINALKWAVREMEKRYKLFQEVGSRDILSYRDQAKTGKKRKFTNPDTNETREEELPKLPYIVIVIDELADLMASHGKEVEGAIVRIAQMARAVGMHLIVSTQRPSVEVITGLIKANITTRIAFQVATQIDSRTILDMAGSEKLLGNGDMLFLSASSPKPKRIQGVFVSESEVKRVVKFFKKQKEERERDKEESEENFSADISEAGVVPAGGNGALDFSEASLGEGQGDDLYQAAKDEVVRSKKASASLLQRRLRVGYARAARLLDILEGNGVIGPADGAKPREVFIAPVGDGTVVEYESPQEDQEKRDKWQM